MILRENSTELRGKCLWQAAVKNSGSWGVARRVRLVQEAQEGWMAGWTESRENS